MRTVSYTLLIAAFVLAFQSSAADWPAWFGANHDGVSEEKISTNWKDGPKVLWKVPVGAGLGTFVVSKGKAYCVALTESPKAAAQRAVKGGVESILSLDANTGKQLWAAPVGVSILNEKQGNDGPRSTPAISDGKIYANGTYLNLACFDAEKGTPVWAHDCEKEFGAGIQLSAGGIKQWACSNSPVIDGDLLFLHCGGAGKALKAFDKNSGKVVWESESDLLTHTTPTVATIQGVRQVIFFTQSGLVSMETKSGKVLWRYKFPFNVSTAISPVVGGDIVFCSAGYGVGGGAVKITKDGETLKATEIWRDQKVVNHWSTPVYSNGYLYGLFGFKQFHTEPIKCIEMATGKEMWAHNGFGQGGTALVGGNVLILGEDGQVVLCEASEKAYKELARAEPLTYKCWNQAIVSDGRIYARSNKEAACLEVK